MIHVIKRTIEQAVQFMMQMQSGVHFRALNDAIDDAALLWTDDAVWVLYYTIQCRMQYVI